MGSRLLYFADDQHRHEDHPPDRASHTEALSPALLRGRICELSSEQPAALLTLATRLIVAAQRQGRDAAWLYAASTPLYPPDLADAGVALADLTVARLPAPHDVPRAAEMLLRAGVALAVLDFIAGPPRNRDFLHRLAGIVRCRDCATLCLTTSPPTAPSLGALVGVRLNAVLARRSRGGFTLSATVLKDKRGALHRTFSEVYRGPLGLR